MTGDITQITKNLYSGTLGKGRKLKPSNYSALITKVENQVNSKSCIVTLGVFSKLPKDIAVIIHDKELYKNITPLQKKQVAVTIVNCLNNEECFVHLKHDGLLTLQSIDSHPEIDFRRIFNTQERQIILG